MKRITALLISVMILLSVAGCADENRDTQIVQTEPSGELKIYYSATPLYTDAISRFKTDNPDVDVQTVVFDSQSVMDSRVAAELAAGSSADLFLLNAKDTALDVFKLSARGYFLDLSEYMSNDIYRDSYFEGILDAGNINGRHYLMPLGFDFMSLYVSQEMLKRQEIELSEGFGFDELMGTIVKNIEKYSEDNGKASISFVQKEALKPGMMSWLEIAGIKVIDIAGGEIVADREALRKTAAYIRDLMNESARSTAVLSKYARDFAGAFSNVTFVARSDFYLSGAAVYNYWFKDKLDEKFELVTVPEAGTMNGYTGIIWLYGSVNAKTNNPGAAYALLSMIANYPADHSAGNYGKYPSGINRDLINSNINALKAKSNNLGEPMLPGELADKVQFAYDIITGYSIRNASVYAIVNEAFTGYINGDVSFDDCFDEMRRMLSEYLDE